MIVAVKEPKGLIPRLTDSSLPNECATIAENCNLKGGSMAPLYSPLFTATLPDALRKTIYKYDISGEGLFCGTMGTLLAFQAVRNGTFSITFGTTAYTIGGIDFSSCATEYDIASVIQIAIRDQVGGFYSCTYDLATDSLIIATSTSAISVLSAGETAGATDDIIVQHSTANGFNGYKYTEDGSHDTYTSAYWNITGWSKTAIPTLYFKYTASGTLLEVFSDSARSLLVAHNASSGTTGTKTLTADGGSGIAGTISVDVVAGDGETWAVTASLADTVSASTTVSTNYSWKAVDNSLTDQWIGTANILPTWWQVAFSRAWTVAQFRFHVHAVKSPKDFLLQGTNTLPSYTESGGHDLYTSGYQNITGWNEITYPTLYLKYSSTTLSIYPTSADRIAGTNKLAHCTASTVGVKNLIEDNSSGFDGTITVGQVATSGDTWEVTAPAWTTIQSYTNTNVTANTWTSYFTVLTANQHAYKYYRFYNTTCNGSAIFNSGFNEIEFCHVPVDISGATYMNGTSGTVADRTTTEWLSWTEDHVNVVRSPEAGDLYERVYWTGETGGKMKVRGTFGTRDVGLVAPTGALTATATDNYTESWACRFYFSNIATYGTPIGTPVACTLISELATESGYMLTFNFPGGASTAGLTDKNYEFELSMHLGDNTTHVLKMKWNIGDKTTVMTDSGGHTWGYAELTQIEAYPTVTYSGSAPTMTGTATECVVTMILNMNYQYPSITNTAYVYRYINDLSKASPNSTATAVLTKDATDKMVLSNIAYSNDTNIAWIEFYRIVGSGTAVMYRYVDRIANVAGGGTTTYEDWVTDLNLGAQIISVENPPANMLGLVTMPNGIGVGFVNRTLYFSELPSVGNGIESFPILYAKPVQNPIKGLMVTGSEVMVLNEGIPKMVTGSDPRYMRVIDLPSTQACIAHRGICKVANTIMYPSGDGMANLTGANSSNGTKNFIQKQQWEALHPELMTASVFDDRLHVFLADKTYLFEPIDGMKALTTSPVIASGCYTDLKDDTLYIIQGANIMAWNRDYLNPMLMTWRSKEFEYSRPASWNCIKVVAQSYPTVNPILFKCYANGVLVSTTTILSDVGIRLPNMRKERSWMFEIVSYVEVHEFHVAQSTGELYQQGW